MIEGPFAEFGLILIPMHIARRALEALVLFAGVLTIERSSLSDFRVTNRGGKGIIGIVNSKRNGNVTSNLIVSDNDQIILSTDKGRVIRVQVKEIRIAGRNTQGVRIIKLSGEEKVVSAIKIEDNID